MEKHCDIVAFDTTDLRIAPTPRIKLKAFTYFTEMFNGGAKAPEAFCAMHKVRRAKFGDGACLHLEDCGRICIDVSRECRREAARARGRCHKICRCILIYIYIYIYIYTCIHIVRMHMCSYTSMYLYTRTMYVNILSLSALQKLELQRMKLKDRHQARRLCSA